MRYLLFLVLLVASGCATAAMRNGVAQAEYELSKAVGEEADFRRERALTLLNTWRNSYGPPTRNIDDASFYPVLEAMEAEGSLLTSLKDVVGGVLGGGSFWEELLAVVTGVLTVVGGRLYLSNRRHRREKAAMFRAIEKSASSELKSEIAKEVTRASAFGAEVKNSTTPKVRNGLQA